ncbi:MAG: isoaspartyl peptidase/L-asparaginase [Acidobacteriota bacterium]|nr:isoaspartyl peptidase/L-asparaginase [Acidobacteriota bacterium]
MKKMPLLFLFFLIAPLALSGDKPEYAIALHGGAGTILKKNMTPEKEKAFQEIITSALRAGEKILAEGGSSLDAVVAAIIIMEDSPLFNAGKGAVFTNQGRNELDASIMNGADLNAGAVAGVTIVKNPIILARKVMENSKHVLLSGAGAEVFAKDQNLEIVDNKYFFTQRRWDRLQEIKKKEKESAGSADFKTGKHGTVGVVALDKNGNIAAGTSTGGLTNKRFGRVGDSPIIGAGTYADNKTCGVSATGQGEYFIRAAVAHRISALMEYKGLSVQKACDQVIHGTITDMKALGGVVAMDADGNPAFSFNTPGMYRGYLKAGGKPYVGIYGDGQ